MTVMPTCLTTAYAVAAGSTVTQHACLPPMSVMRKTRFFTLLFLLVYQPMPCMPSHPSNHACMHAVFRRNCLVVVCDLAVVHRGGCAVIHHRASQHLQQGWLTGHIHSKPQCWASTQEDMCDGTEDQGLLAKSSSRCAENG